jgi:DNA-binding transcriptional ArsR family regulator
MPAKTLTSIFRLLPTISMQPSFETLIACFACDVRSSVLQLLMEDGPMTMGALAAELGIAASTASAHVAVLRDLGIVEVRRDGRETYVDALVGGVELVLLPLPSRGGSQG